jgi:hypothetical protein
MSIKSNFWTYRIFNSKRQRYQNGKSEGNWTGPFFFESPANNLEVKKWIREHLGISDTSHIEVKVSLSEMRNNQAYSTWKKQKEKELNRELRSESNRVKTPNARPGNLIVKWLKAEVV